MENLETRLCRLERFNRPINGKPVSCDNCPIPSERANLGRQDVGRADGRHISSHSAWLAGSSRQQRRPTPPLCHNIRLFQSASELLPLSVYLNSASSCNCVIVRIMDTAATTDVQATSCNPQLQCPLFSTLPGEIRNEIFALALVQYEDSENAYPEDSYWYRPGFSGPRKSSSALLQTCKAAYFEGQKAFLRELEWAFWFDRGPEGRTGMNSCLSFFRKLTPQQSQDLKKVRFFMQMFRFENGTELHRLFHQPNFNPEKLTITIRYSDWWYWESDTPLRMKEDWLRRFSGPAGLRELRVEYETITRKRDAMMKIVERNKKWKLSVGDLEEGGHLSAEGTKLVEWRWHGKSALGGTKWYHHGDGDTMEYVVVTDTWRYVPGLMSEEDLKKREILPPEHDPAQDSDDSDRSDEEEEDDDADYSEYEIEDEDL
ncbi:hypothetical protein RB213_002216 [Colletotrichum asianum]